jgi:hypothetical protein
MTKSVTILIDASTQQAANAVANEIIATMNNVATWANTNQTGLVNGITARTQDVTVVATKSTFSKDVNGDLILVP